jgi:pyruvate,water dikinase
VQFVWESGRTDAARAYRVRKGLPPEPRIGVVVQALIEPVAAGVLFTRNPITGARERLIEAAWGLGEAVVNGSVVPDRARLDTNGAVLEVTPGDKDVKVWYGEHDGTVEVPVDASLRSQLCVTPVHFHALHELADRCHRVWGPDLDIEWALGHDDKIYLLQCRPITTLRAS